MKNLNPAEISIVTGGVTEGPNGEGCTEPHTGTKGKEISLPGATLEPQLSGF
ncbi:hypothetical protein [Altererythrobacter sp. ZODW24]|uniref:hypothetical protein n=1 Tax=Altererythrobacter sp. ZODW24 TaxID=2185142 RepID=UPI0013B4215D|nr:hypothetical protein [Altererythrobacter sp. ZODW24]